MMEAQNIGRILVLLLSLLVYIAAVLINALAGSGKGPFSRSTGNVSAQYETEITPAGWTFSIWGIIYSWLLLMHVYFLSWICRRTSSGRMYCSPTVLPFGFFVSWIINMILNITWLLLWDRELMIPALICLAVIAFTSYLLIFFSCVCLRDHGVWLKQNHPTDLLCFYVLVQNSIATYATWTTIATLLNLTIVLDVNSMSATSAATVSLCTLLVEVITWFVVENFVIEKHVRYILTVYPVIIFALSGSLNKHYDAAAPGRNAVFSAVLLALACVFFTIRLLLVIWRHRTRPLFQDGNTEGLITAVHTTQK